MLSLSAQPLPLFLDGSLVGRGCICLMLCEDAQVTLARYGPVVALAVWEAAYAEPFYLVSNLADAEAALEWHRQRAKIETFFSDQQSRGFQMHKSHLSDPARLRRLLLAACLAYLRMV